MRRFVIWLRQRQHKCLLLVSESYRKHDFIVKELQEQRNLVALLREDVRRQQCRGDELLKEGQKLSDRLTHALNAQESATQQLIAERALRQTAEERADRYHEELTESLKSSANWMCRSMGKKSMFGVDPNEPDPSPPKREPLDSKPMARQEAAKVMHQTLEEMWAELRKEVPVGPEVSSI